MKKILRWALFIGLAAIVLILALGLILNLVWGNELQAELEKLREQGVVLSIAPKPIPVSENAAAFYKLAFSELEGIPQELRSQMIDYGNRRSLTEIDLKAVEAGFEKYEQTINLLLKPMERPKTQYDLDYSRQLNIELPHLTQMIQATKILQGRAEWNLKRSHVDQVLLDAKAIFRLARLDEPLLVSQLMSSVVFELGAIVMQRVLAEKTLTEAQCRDVSSLLDPARPQSLLCLGLKAELSLALEWASAGFPGVVITPEQRNYGAQFLPWVPPLAKGNILNYIRTMKRIIELSEKPYWESAQAERNLEKEFQQFSGPFNLMTGCLTPSMECHSAFAHWQARIAVLKTALDPEHRPEIDPFTGKPLIVKDGGRLIYSVGKDLEDNGGDDKKDVVIRLAARDR